MKALRTGLLLAAAAAFATVVVAGAGATSATELGDLGNKRTAVAAHAHGKKKNASQQECIAVSGGANTRLDCDDPFPNNEPHIVVDPANPQHMVASSNDYGSCCDQYYTTFNGGTSWSTGNMSTEKGSPIGSDPVTSIDRKHGTTLHASLNFFLSKDGTQACDGDVVVSPSKDGGLNWLPPVVVDNGTGCDLDKTQVFDDKEWIVTDNNPSSRFYGRTYLTWSQFLSHNGEYVSSAIVESHSDDGGFKWSDPQEISGSNPALCTFQTAGHNGRCDENQFSVPTVAPDGTVYVAFQNAQNSALWEPGEQFDDQYLLVKSGDGGQKWSKPKFVVGLEDGSRDYPLNVDGSQTLTGYQVRMDSAGNIVASPRDGKLYLTFSDNRSGVHDSDNPVTNTDVFVMSSANGGTSWSTPSKIDAGGGDQWFPWVDVNPVTGAIGVLYNDRGAANGPTHTAALAEGSFPGTLAKTTLSTGASDPTDSIYFQAEIPGCAECATFHGDYISLAYGSDGRANAVWTDMRDVGDPDGDRSQFIYYARK